MKEAVDEEVVGFIIGWMDDEFSIEGAIQWLLAPNPQLHGKSAAFLLLDGQEELVRSALEFIRKESLRD